MIGRDLVVLRNKLHIEIGGRRSFPCLPHKPLEKLTQRGRQFFLGVSDVIWRVESLFELFVFRVYLFVAQNCLQVNKYMNFIMTSQRVGTFLPDAVKGAIEETKHVQNRLEFFVCLRVCEVFAAAKTLDNQIKLCTKSTSDEGNQLESYNEKVVDGARGYSKGAGDDEADGTSADGVLQVVYAGGYDFGHFVACPFVILALS